MSGTGLIGAALIFLIMQVALGALPIKLSGNAYLLYLLVSLFTALVVYQIFRDPGL